MQAWDQILKCITLKLAVYCISSVTRNQRKFSSMIYQWTKNNML